MISANGGLPAHRYTPQVTPRWPRGSEPAPNSPNPSQRYSRVAPLPSRSGRCPPCRPLCYIIRGKEGASKLIGYWPLTWSAGVVYYWGVGAAEGHGDVELILCFCTILGDGCSGSAAYIVGIWGR